MEKRHIEKRRMWGTGILLWSLTTLLLPLNAFADHKLLPESKELPSIKLNDLILEVLSKNSSLKAEKAGNEAAAARTGPIGSYDDPILSFEAMNYPVDTFSRRDFGMTGNQISLSQKIPFPGKLGKKREAAESDSKVQEETAKAKELEIVKMVKLAYYQLYLNYRKLDTLNEEKGVLEQLTTVTRNKYALGKTSQAEVLNLQLETANVIDNTLEMERMIKGLLGELNHLLGRSDHGQFLYGRPEPLQNREFDFSKYSEKNLFDLALQKSPQANGRKAAQQAAESRLSYAKKSYLPDFDFKVGYTIRESNRMDDGTDFVSGAVGITIPLWAGTKQSGEVREAQAERIKAEALFDEERNRLAHDIHATYAELEEATKRIKLYEGGVLPLSRQAVNSARSAYLTGRLEYSTLLNTIQRRYQLEIAHAEALAALHSKIAELETILGNQFGDPL